MSSKLNFIEISLYFCIWISANILCLYKLYEAQNEVLAVNNLQDNLVDLKPGWRFLSRYKDVSDLEWSSWKYFFQTSWYYLMFQFLISEMLRIINISLLRYWYIVSSVIFLLTYMGQRQFMIVSIQPCIFLLIILSGGGKRCIWLVSFALLTCYNTLKYRDFFWYFLERDNLHDEEVYLVLVCVAWIKLRCISFCIEYVDRMERTKSCDNDKFKTPSTVWDDIINMLSYTLYLPLLYTGPVILYEDFVGSFQAQSTDVTKRLRKFVKDMALFMTYTFLFDLSFHYIYFLAMQNEIESIRKLPSLALCGGGLWMGFEFHMKYVISYGTTAAFARLDNMDPPPTPRCIARIHVYSQMWRYFDVGLYKFLLKYIYKPSFNILSRYLFLPVMVQKLTASLASFIFIYVWHGTVMDIFIWSLLNFIGITLEHFGKAISRTEQYKCFKNSILRTDEMEVRFIAVVCTPLLVMSAISNFYLFAGRQVGNLYFGCFAHPNLWNFVFVTMAMYSCCQVSMALQNVPSRTDIRSDNKVVI